MAGARRFTDLAAWQRAHEVHVAVQPFLARAAVRRDATFCRQLADAAASAPRNIAEGFGRYRPRENAQYVRVAHGSLTEVLSLLIEGQVKGYLAEEDLPPLLTAAHRAIGTVVNYLKYLKSCPPRPHPPSLMNPELRTSNSGTSNSRTAELRNRSR